MGPGNCCRPLHSRKVFDVLDLPRYDQFVVGRDDRIRHLMDEILALALDPDYRDLEPFTALAHQ